MKQYVRCKACGYVMEESKLGAVCPACGVKREMFIPDTEKLSEKRRKILDSHIHPIIVHAPQGLPTLLIICIIVALVLRGELQTLIRNAIVVFATILPFTVIGGFLSGIYDGKVRFRKLSTPLLRLKIIGGSVFFALAVVGAAAVWLPVFDTTAGLIVELAIQAGCFACTVLLGTWGASMVNAKFPG